MPTVIVRDQSTAGIGSASSTLEFPSEHLTVRELIRERVYQEVQDYNRRRDGAFRGLIQPSDAEVAINGYRLKPGRELDWKRQFERACEAFNARGFLLLIGDRQTTSLDDEVTLSRGVEVTFLRLVPLVGG